MIRHPNRPRKTKTVRRSLRNRCACKNWKCGGPMFRKREQLVRAVPEAAA